MGYSISILVAGAIFLSLSFGCAAIDDPAATEFQMRPMATPDDIIEGVSNTATPKSMPTATQSPRQVEEPTPMPTKFRSSATPTVTLGAVVRPDPASEKLLDCTPHSLPQRTQRSLAVDPYDDDKLYIGVEQEGFFKTVDGGKTWQRAVDGIKAWGRTDGPKLCYEEFYSTIIDPQNPSRICIAMAGGPGTASLANTSAGNNGVYCSVDSGSSWVQRVGPQMNTAVYTLAADPNNFDVIYAGVNGGSCSNLPPVCEPDTYFNNVGSVYKTTDGGLTWAELDTLAARDVRVISLQVDPLNPETVVAATFSKVTVQGGGAGKFEESTQMGLIRSRDGGETWTSSVQGMNSSPREQALLGLETSPTVPSRLYVTASSNTSYWSSDGGQTFHPARRMTAFAFDPFDAEGLHMLGSNGESIQESHDGGESWTVIAPTPGYVSFQTGVPTALVWSKNNADTVFLAGPYSTVHRSTDAGRTWSQLLSAEMLPD